MSGYRAQSRDTSVQAERWLIDRYRAMPTVRKVQLLQDLSRTSEALALAGFRHRHPHADAYELRMRVAAARLGASTVKAVFGWSADDENAG
jgi:hypothetical protein